MNLPAGSPDERRLIKRFRALDAPERETLLAFADFLAQRLQPEPPAPIPRAPLPIVRPEHETVVGAIKRLSRTYEMLERDSLLNETSALMSAHVLRGRPASAVIDDLERLFERHYQAYQAGFEAQSPPDTEQRS